MYVEKRDIETTLPTVTVGIPAYNTGERLRRAVTSVQKQTWEGSLEILIYNDGSIDDTMDIAKELAHEDHRIRIIGSSKNMGRPHARNSLLHEARGQYFAWQDSDDEWCPEKLKEQLKQLATAFKVLGHTNVWCVCSCRIVTVTGSSSTSVYKPQISGDQIKNILRGRLRAYLQTTIGLTKTMQARCFDNSLPRLQDLDFFLGFAISGGVFVGTDPETVLVIYNKEDSASKGKLIDASSKVIMHKYDAIHRRYGVKFYRKARARWSRIAATHAATGKQFGLFVLLILRSFFLAPLATIKYLRKFIQNRS